MSKPTRNAPLTSGIVASKGAAVPVSDVAQRSPAEKQPKQPTERTRPLNFRVSPKFEREFKIFAASNSLKLSDLLEQCFESHLEKHGK